MTGLLDTCAFIWLDQDPGKLSADATRFVLDPNNDVLVSVVSVWELVIKVPTGKLTLPDPVADVLSRQLGNGLRLPDVSLDHVLGVQSLPTPHRDPFDRILAAQAIAEGAVFLTSDHIFAQYPVTVVW